MARKHRPSASASLRLPDDVTEIVSRLAGATGWSEGNALAFLARAGWNAVNGKGEKIAGFKEFMSAAVDHHEAEIAARKKLAITSSKLREARKALSPSPASSIPTTRRPPIPHHDAKRKMGRAGATRTETQH